MKRNRSIAYAGWPARGFGVDPAGGGAGSPPPASDRPVIKVSLEMAATAGGVSTTPLRPGRPASRRPVAPAPATRQPSRGTRPAAARSVAPAGSPSPGAAGPSPQPAPAAAAGPSPQPAPAAAAGPSPQPAAAAASGHPSAAPLPGRSPGDAAPLRPALPSRATGPAVAVPGAPAPEAAAEFRRPVRAVSLPPRFRTDDDEPVLSPARSRKKPPPEVEPLPPLRLPSSGARTFLVPDLAAAGCAARIEEAVARIPGVAHAEASAGTGLLAVEPAGADEGAVEAAVAAAGHRLASGPDAAGTRRPLVAAGLATALGLLAHALRVWAGVPALAVAAAAGSLAAAWPAIGPAVRHVRRGRLAPEILPLASGLVVLGAAVAGAAVPPEVAAAPLVVHLLGLAGASALRARVRNTLDRLEAAVPGGPGPRPGERVELPPGAVVPADGRLLAAATVDETPLGGDLLERVAGEPAIAGSFVPEGAHLEVVAPAGRGLASRALAVARRAAATGASPGKAGAAARYFPPAVLAAAAVTGVLAGPGAAAAVLGAAAPLALAAAVPLALAGGLGLAVASGAAPRSVEALLRAGRLRTAVLDKTTALARGAAAVTDFVARPGHDSLAALGRAAAAVAGLDHPWGRALEQHAADIGVAPPAAATDRTVVPGAGVRARVEGRAIALGTAPFLAAAGIETGTFSQLARELGGRGRTPLFLAVDGEVAAVAGIADSALPSSRRALGRLELRNVDVLVASGDAAPATKWLARTVGLAPSAGKGDLSPEGTRELLGRLRKTGATALASGAAADAPALAASDLGIAVAGSPEVEAVAGAVLVLPDPSALAGLVEAGRAARVAAATSGVLAAAGSGTGLLLAAAGMLGPLGAAACALATTALALGAAALPGLQALR